MGDAEPRPLEPRDLLAGLSQLGRTATGERTAYLTLVSDLSVVKARRP